MGISIIHKGVWIIKQEWLINIPDSSTPLISVDTFDDKVEYLLVIATPIEVHLLGVSVGSGSIPHTLYITNMSVPTDNVAIKSIVGTADGRIFMNGNDGRLWEIDYQAEEGWFSKKCSKREVIGSPLSYFIPTFLSKIRVDPIIKVVLDESRQTMYGLTENSNIEVRQLSVFWEIQEKATGIYISG